MVVGACSLQSVLSPQGMHDMQSINRLNMKNIPFIGVEDSIKNSFMQGECLQYGGKRLRWMGYWEVEIKISF